MKSETVKRLLNTITPEIAERADAYADIIVENGRLWRENAELKQHIARMAMAMNALPEQPSVMTEAEYHAEQLDKYAIPAMQGACSNHVESARCSYAGIAKQAYDQAEAMIYERNGRMNAPTE